MIVGYTPGVYDLFHIGHLNILRRSRLQCDYLIAGVTTDAEALKVKGRAPVRSQEERMAIVGAVRYVDRVYLDQSAIDKTLAWHDLKFDVIFKGSDWMGTPKGVALERDMAAVGARVVYLPYTSKTSSTQLRTALGVDQPRGGAELSRPPRGVVPDAATRSRGIA
jgi:glycerol-3-phosphate cytidylyltransferase